MPEGCSHAKHERSKRTGTSDISRALDMEFYNPTSLKVTDPNEVTLLERPNALNRGSSEWTQQGGLKEWVVKVLRRHGPPSDTVPGLTSDMIVDRIIDHIEKWPDAGKEQLRKILVEFISQNAPPPRSIDFRWKIGNTANGIEYAAFKPPNATRPINPATPVIPQLQAGENLQVTFVNTTAQIRVEAIETFVDV